MKSLAWSWGLLPLLVLTSVGWSDRAIGSVLPTQSTFEGEMFLATNQRVGNSRELYKTGQFAEAAEILQQAAEAFAAQGNNRDRAIALSNLSLAYQQLGDWTPAQEAIANSLEALDVVEGNTNPILAQILQVRAQLELSTGQANLALETWKEAAEIYKALDDDGGRFASQINQAQALQALGFYRRALKVLAQVKESLAERPNSALKAQTLLALGNTLRVVGKLEPPEPPETEIIQEIQNLDGTIAPVEVSENAIATPQSSDDDPDDDEENLNATEILSESLDIATRLNLPELQAKAQLSLGNTAQSLAQRAKESSDRFRKDSPNRNNDGSEKDWRYYNQRYIEQLDRALLKYQSAANLSGIAPQNCINADGNSGVDPRTCIDAKLNTLRLFIENGEWEKTGELIPKLQTQIDRLTPGRFSANARVNLAQSAIDIFQSDSWGVDEVSSADMAADIARQLQEAVGEARSLKDLRAESFALGTLGKLYQLTGQFAIAQEVTELALKRSHAVRASSISYQWQWQLGQLLEVQNKPEEAIAPYAEAVATLKTLRGDLAAISPDLQFSFRDSIEPIYRDFVDVLLQHQEGEQVSPENLKLARDTIEALQLAELDNFFREACIDAKPKEIDDVDPKAAVIYSIVIGDRLEVIAALPDPTPKPTKEETGEEVEPILLHATETIDRKTLDDIILTVQDNTRGEVAIVPVFPDGTPSPEPLQDSPEPFQPMYDWLIRPIEDELAASQVETLVFVLDGKLRNVPMSVLHDGEQYLIEKYAIALTPGLQLLSVNPIREVGLTTLAAGLSNMPEKWLEKWQPLDWVDNELEAIGELVPSQQLLDEGFTATSLQNNITATPSAIVHLATHGQFSSNAEETYLLSWDKLIDINLLNRLLQSRDGRKTAIELLVLSACQTAVGDDRAALGLAGVAVRAGARSTVASLWFVDDKSTAQLMTRFYEELKTSGISKAEALRNAQLSLLDGENVQFQHPAHWAAFVLVGNWQ
ncbi:CHAT domain-containing protein [Oscillatoriales cyanobacterium LEGE 11467]|uniref:CHAT domain-containing protein n=1 Tax=Zarconia navalis LEGE 11467 TaxID=1828826 RepID=A0A928VZB0_9CYAN|nr:CHAT domain-containing protein [Zarconia navalis]MBE9041071.1 CHAT domain-containing protein [Zarconia navalis LEGE 11467]